MKQSKYLNILLITLAIILSSTFVNAASTSETANQLTELLDSPIKIPHPSYLNTSTGSETVPFWLILTVFTMLFSLIYVLTIRLPMFNKDGKLLKGPVVAFAAAMTLTAIFASPICETIARWTVTFSKLAMLALFVIAIAFLWFTTASSFSAGRKMAAEAGAEAASAIAKHHAADVERVRARRDLDDSRRTIKKETADLNKAERELKNVMIDTKNEIRALKEVARIIHRLQGVSDEGEAAKLKQAYQRQLAVLSSLITHESKNLHSYQAVIRHLEGLGHHLLKDEKDERAMISKLNMHIRSAIGARTIPTAKMPHIASLARKCVDLNVKQEKLVKEIEAQMKLVQTEDNKAIDEIRAVTQNIHINNFPQALHHINNAITIKQNIEKQANRAHHWDMEIRNIEAQHNHLILELEALLK